MRYSYNGGIVRIAGVSILMLSGLNIVAQEPPISEAQELPESIMLGAVMFGHREMQSVIAAIKELASEGGKDAWEKNWQVTLNTTAPELLKLIDAKLSEGWTRVSGVANRDGAKSLWRFSDEEGMEWGAVAEVEPNEQLANSFHLRIMFARSESASK